MRQDRPSSTFVIGITPFTAGGALDEAEAAGLLDAFLEAKREASEERVCAAAPAVESATSAVSP